MTERNETKTGRAWTLAKARRSSFLGPIAILLAAALIWIPYQVRGLSCGHDFDFHFQSWFEVVRAWHSGQLYPHWSADPNWGAGEPRFVFYPPLSWILGALLGSLVGWPLMPPVFIWLLLALTGLSVRALAREWLSDYAATLAGAIAIFSGYTLFTAFERSAMSELAAGALIPLALLFTLRAPNQNANTTWQRALNGSTFSLALVIALTWLTNAPSAVMVCYLVFFVALATACFNKTLWPLIRAAIALTLGILGAGIYILPAAYQQRWIEIAQATDPGMRVEDSWLFARHSQPDLAFHDFVLLTASWIVVAMLTATLLGFLIARVRNQLRILPRTLLAILLLIPLIILLMQFPISQPLWHLIPKLAFLQFPWRLLLLLESPMAILLAVATFTEGWKSRTILSLAWTALFVLIVSAGGLVFYQTCDADDSIAGQIGSITSATGFAGTDEYTSKGADNSILATGLPDACLLESPDAELAHASPDSTPAFDPEQNNCDATFTASLWQPEHKRLTAETDEDGFLLLHLRRYPAWLITLNGQPQQNLPQRQDGLIVIPIQSGINQITVDWQATADLKLGRLISLASLPFFLALFFVERKLQRKSNPAPLSLK